MLNMLTNLVPLVVGLALTASAYALPLYKVTDLGSLDGGDSVAYSLNNLGQVVGESSASGVVHAFLWDASSGIRNLGTLSPFQYSNAYGINDLGQVVGRSHSPGSGQAFIWTDGAGMQSLATLTGTSRAIAYGINNAGMIVGQSEAGTNRGFLWNPATGLHDVTSPTGYSYAYSVNAFGVVAGATFPDGYPRPAIWSVGLGSVDLVASSGEARDINDSLQVVGWTGNIASGSSQAFVWDFANGLRPLDHGGLGYSRANAINASGVVVGRSGGGALVWDPSTGMHILNSLIDPGSGWRLDEAIDINDHGQIVGTGINPQGITRAFLLTPVPEPETYIMMLSGLGLLGLAVRHRSRQAGMRT